MKNSLDYRDVSKFIFKLCENNKPLLKDSGLQNVLHCIEPGSYQTYKLRIRCAFIKVSKKKCIN